jgi:RHS repeat-associated protein
MDFGYQYDACCEALAERYDIGNRTTEIALPADLAAAPAGPGLHSFSGVGWVGADANGNTILWSSTGTTTYPADLGLRSFSAVGTVLASYAYDPFGNPLAEGPTLHSFSEVGLPYTFSTKPHAPLTHHAFYGYRCYTPDTGRWLSRDPIEEAGGSNIYHMASKDVNDFVDPHGDDCIAISSRTVVPLFPWGHYALELLRGCCPPKGDEKKYNKLVNGVTCSASNKIDLHNTQGVSVEWYRYDHDRKQSRWIRTKLSALMGISVINRNVLNEKSDYFSNIYYGSDGDVDHKWSLIISASTTYEYAEQGADGFRMRSDRITYTRFPKSVYYAFGNNSNVFVRSMMISAGIQIKELTNKRHPPVGQVHPDPNGLKYDNYRNPRAVW